MRPRKKLDGERDSGVGFLENTPPQPLMGQSRRAREPAKREVRVEHGLGSQTDTGPPLTSPRTNSVTSCRLPCASVAQFLICGKGGATRVRGASCEDQRCPRTCR